MDEQKIAEKTLEGELMLCLYKAQLSREEACALKRPSGSFEIYMRLEKPGGRWADMMDIDIEDGLIAGGSTPPSASWYLTEEQLRALHGQIKTMKDYKIAWNLLERIKKDHIDLEQFIEYAWMPKDIL